MPAYSYKEQFVPYVMEGSKTHTIRALRKYQVKPGDMLYHYYGMRTKYCKKLRQDTCKEVLTIAIGKNGNVIIAEIVRPSQFQIRKLKRLTHKRGHFKVGQLYARSLTDIEKELLAWKDGFRPPGSSLDDPAGSFALMLDFWKKTHSLPFVGNLIYWNPK